MIDQIINIGSVKGKAVRSAGANAILLDASNCLRTANNVNNATSQLPLHDFLL